MTLYRPEVMFNEAFYPFKMRFVNNSSSKALLYNIPNEILEKPGHQKGIIWPDSHQTLELAPIAQPLDKDQHLFIRVREPNSHPLPDIYVKFWSDGYNQPNQHISLIPNREYWTLQNTKELNSITGNDIAVIIDGGGIYDPSTYDINVTLYDAHEYFFA